jgi:hypothetical protein
LYVVQYVPDRLSEASYLFEALKWLTDEPDEELQTRLRRCGSQYANLVANLFCLHTGLQPQLADTRRDQQVTANVQCCAVM